MPLLSFFLIFLGLLFCADPQPTQASAIEASAGFSFNRSNYGSGNYSWNRRWGASVGYKFSPVSSIELAVQDVVDRTLIVGYEDTRFHDEIYSLNWVQNLFTFASV
ncbi:hypothetical protein EBZ37_13690, partial [bacterium]|nr:hypothetical protein [bacterium]